jgi:Zn-dependent peptidase ImmA (M78 family)
MLVSEQVQEKDSAQKIFELDFSGPVGQYFKKKRKGCNSPNSEAFRTSVDNTVVIPTGRRLKQFLHGAEKITRNYITLEGENEGRVDIDKLAKDLGYTILDCDNLLKMIKEKAKEKSKWEYFVAKIKAPKNNKDIDGFSIPNEKLIYYKEGIKPEFKNFVIAHELSHYLLGHKGMFFYRDASEETQQEENQDRQIENSNSDVVTGKLKKKNKKKNHEKIEYREEADRLAAILLMPYVFMRKFKDINNEALAKKFQVRVKAIKKRRDEVIKEREKICFVPSLHTEGVTP